MALSAGTRLGSYEILAPLGAGGMGEVYRARDPRLKRDVALKVLPEEMAQDSGRLERFQREAHLLAALNHPHIAAIHGLEEADGQPFLVLELVEGEDLRERLARGAIPVDEALEIAVQVAEALEEAHNAGIVHRDLKPANVKVTPEGKVKVLDFGLAEAWVGDVAGSASSASMSESPTLAHSGTQAGIILGTAAYMSPEQARGKPVDKRTDVWAFGVLLWEILTGRTLFAGDTVTDVIAAVVTKEPDLDALPTETPRSARRLITRCLRKDPRARLPDMGGARLDLQEILADGTTDRGEEASASGEVRRLARQRRVWAACAIVAVGVAVFLGFVRPARLSGAGPVAYLVLDPPEGWSFNVRGWPVPSPDGRHVAIRAWSEDQGAETMFWLRSLDSPAFRPLTGTEGILGDDPFWSPDSRFVGFAAEGELRRLSIVDGVVETVCTLPTDNAGLADWSDDGTILFSGRPEPQVLYTVPATGGEAQLLIRPDATKGEDSVGLPQFLPDGRRFLFDAWRAEEPLATFVASLDDPDGRRLIASGIGHLELAGPHVVFNREDRLFAQSFDPRRAELSGEPQPIASSVAAISPSDSGAFGVSPGGTLAYLSGETVRDVQLAWLDRTGEQVGTIGSPAPYGQIALSPDERRLAVVLQDAPGLGDLWVIDVARGVPSRFTSDPADENSPIWSPDGQELAFSRLGSDGFDVFRKRLHGGATAEPLLDSPGHEFPKTWARDGESLLYLRINSYFTEFSVWARPLADGEPPGPVVEPVEKTRFRVAMPQLSPNGRWVAYISNESGAYEVYVEPFQRPGERVRVSVDGGSQPMWRSDGKEMFYRRPDGPLMAVEIQEEAERLEVSLPTQLFNAGELGSQGSHHYAVSADGQRFLVKLAVEDDNKLQMHVVVNWESLLEAEE